MYFKQLESGFFTTKILDLPINTKRVDGKVDTHVSYYERPIVWNKEKKLFGIYHPDNLHPITKEVDGSFIDPKEIIEAFSGTFMDQFRNEEMYIVVGLKMNSAIGLDIINKYISNGLWKYTDRIEQPFGIMGPDGLKKFTSNPFKSLDSLDVDLKMAKITIEGQDKYSFDRDDAILQRTTLRVLTKSLRDQLDNDMNVLISTYSAEIEYEHLLDDEDYTMKVNVEVYVIYHSESPFAYDLNWLRRKDVALPLMVVMNRDHEELTIESLPGSVIKRIMSFI
jgi:hypothetical protein